VKREDKMKGAISQFKCYDEKETIETVAELLEIVYGLGIQSTFSPAKARSCDRKLDKLTKKYSDIKLWKESK
jgi:hypothetical protein